MMAGRELDAHLYFSCSGGCRTFQKGVQQARNEASTPIVDIMLKWNEACQLDEVGTTTRASRASIVCKVSSKTQATVIIDVVV